MANSATTEKVADILKETFPEYEITHEYQDCLVIKDRETGRIFWFGQTNDNWGADVYADGAALASGDIADSIEASISTKDENFKKIAVELITAVRQYR